MPPSMSSTSTHTWTKPYRPTSTVRNLVPSAIVSLTGVSDNEGVDYNAFSVLGKSTNQRACFPTATQPYTSPMPAPRSESICSKAAISLNCKISIVTDSQHQATNGIPTLTPVEPYVYLELQNVSFGCALHTGEDVASTTVQCTVTVAAFAEGSDEEVALASFIFTPPSLAVAPMLMEYAVLPLKFLAPNVVHVTIVQDTPLTQALLVDNVHGFLFSS